MQDSNNEEFNRIEDLKKRLYDREAVVGVTKRSVLVDKYKNIPNKWSDNSDQFNAQNIEPKLTSSWLFKLTVISILIFAVSLSVAGVLLLTGTNLISNRNIDFSIKAPSSVKAGDETPFQILIANRNRLPLEQVKLTIEYPEDTKEPDDVTLVLRNKEINIGVIRPGETVNQSVSAVLFGQEDDVRQIRGVLEYRVSGSNALYQKDTTYDLKINSPPVSVLINVPPESIVDQDADIIFTVVSNAQVTLKDIILVVNYPRGFKFISSSPVADKDSSVWYIGDLKPGDQKEFSVKGNLAGINQEVKTFEAKVGTREGVSDAEFETVFSQMIQTLTLKQPFVSLESSVNGNTSVEPVINSGGLVRLDLKWYNTLPNRVINNEVEAFLTGTPLNKRSISPGLGFYRTSDDSVRWNQVSESKLANISSGDTGSVSFSFSTFSLFDASMMNVVNPTINLKAVIRGSRISEGFSNELVETIINRTIKLNTILKLSSKALHSTGPLQNSGPIPPKVDQETTYTIVLSVVNTSNDVRNSIVRTTLPLGVNFIGEHTSSNEKLTFNEVTREVRWDLGKISAGTGTRSLPREIAFKVGLTPSLASVGQPVVLVRSITLSGTDEFTGTALEDKQNQIDTRLLNEPGFDIKSGLVIE